MSFALLLRARIGVQPMSGRWKSAYGLCQATTKTTGKPCRQMAISPGGRCIWHGGLSVGPRSLAGKIKALRNLRSCRHKTDDELASLARAQLETAERRYIRLRNEADRRRGKK